MRAPFRSSLFIVMFYTFASCGYYAYTKSQALRHAKKLEKKGTRPVGTITDEGRAIRIKYRDSNYLPIDVLYTFDARGKQLTYSVSGCDSCIKKYVKEMLNDTKHPWTRVNDSLYRSPYRKSILKISSSPSMYTISRIGAN